MEICLHTEFKNVALLELPSELKIVCDTLYQTIPHTKVMIDWTIIPTFHPHRII